MDIKVMAAALIAFALLSYTAGNTISYFSDVEVSSGNTFQAGTWSQAEHCEIDSANAKITGNPAHLHNVFIENEGNEILEITKMVWQWEGGGNLTILKIGNRSIAVNQSSPAIITEPISIRKKSPSQLWFEDFNFDNQTFRLTIFFADGSRKEVSFVPCFVD